MQSIVDFFSFYVGVSEMYVSFEVIDGLCLGDYFVGQFSDMVVSILCDVDEFGFEVVYLVYMVVKVLNILCCFWWEVFE